MKLFVLFITWVFFQSCQPASRPEVADCNLSSSASDTAQLESFKSHMRIREAPEPFIPQSDSMYCFRGHDSWGQFDYLCSVFRDSSGYKTAFSYVRNPYLNNDITYTEQQSSIDALAWQGVQRAFEKQNFWCDSFKVEGGSVDGTVYNIWARTGNKFRLIRCDECEPKLDALKILAKNIQKLCGMPLPIGVANYTVKLDSIHAVISSTNPDRGFIRSTEIYFSGKPFPVKHGSAELVLPKKDLQSLKKRSSWNTG